jgi:hypothetical protein
MLLEIQSFSLIDIVQDPEGVKWELGLFIFGWENGISCAGTGIHQKKNSRKWEWHDKI